MGKLLRTTEGMYESNSFPAKSASCRVLSINQKVTCLGILSDLLICKPHALLDLKYPSEDGYMAQIHYDAL